MFLALQNLAKLIDVHFQNLMGQGQEVKPISGLTRTPGPLINEFGDPSPNPKSSY